MYSQSCGGKFCFLDLSFDLIGTLFEAIDTKRLTCVYTLANPFHRKLMSTDASSPILGKLLFHHAPCLYQKQPRLSRAPATTIKSSTAPY